MPRFQESVKKLFVIPEYQRVYSWDVEKCDVLWNDIKDFFESNLKSEKIIEKKILEYSGGSSVATIHKITAVNKIVYCLNIDGVKENFDSLPDAANRIDTGLLKFGNQQYISDDDEIQNIIRGII